MSAPIEPTHLARWMALHAVSDWAISTAAQSALLAEPTEMRATLARLASMPFEQARQEYHRIAYAWREREAKS